MKGSPKRIDLSVPQVAGSAVAAVVAAKLASYFGVYGTILGAGVVSVIATCGGSVFQHFFRRTGEQFRDAAVTGSRTPPPREQAPPASGEFTEGTVYRARVRTRRRPLVAAALVFAVTMAGVTTYELVSGNSFSGGSGTTVGGAVTGTTTLPGSSDSTDPSDPPTPSAPADSTDSTGTSGASGSSGSKSGVGTAASPTPSPSATPSGSASGEPSTAPAPDGSSATAPEPSADSRSGTAGPDRADPAAP